MNVIEHRYRFVGSDRDQDSQTSKIAQTDCVVVGVRVSGGAKNARVQLGEDKLTAGDGVTPWALQVKAGSPICIEFDGSGSVEILGMRVPRGKPMGLIEAGKVCPLCGAAVGDPIEHRC